MLEAQRIAHTFKGSGNIIGLPGIGRMAHRLEDILEYAMDSVGRGEAVNPAMARDSLRAVLALQQMTAYLQGEEAAPQGTKRVLQRLLDWVGWIRTGEALTASPAPLNEASPAPLDGARPEPLEGARLDPLNEADGLAAVMGNEGTAPEPADQAVQAPLASTADAGTLRVGVDRLSRMLRRAGQSIPYCAVCRRKRGNSVRPGGDGATCRTGRANA